MLAFPSRRGGGRQSSVLSKAAWPNCPISVITVSLNITSFLLHSPMVALSCWRHLITRSMIHLQMLGP